MISGIVSIIVPIYNCEKYLDRCIRSILGQTFTNIEVLLINDGSTDKSYHICKEFELQDNRIRVYHQENAGPSSARNVGIKNSTGEYIMFVDADDYIESSMVEELFEKAISERAEFVMCGMTIDTYNSNQYLISSVNINLLPRTVVGNTNLPSNIIDLVESEKINGPCCKLIKADIIRDNSILMPAHIYLQEDLYFNLRVLEYVNVFTVIEGCFYHYNKGLGESVTTRYYSNKFEMTNEVHSLLMNFYNLRCKDITIIKRIMYIYIKNIYAALINLCHPNCPLTRMEKLEYISNITHSKKYNEMVELAYKSGIKYQILKYVLKFGNITLIYYISKLIYFLRAKLGVRY